MVCLVVTVAGGHAEKCCRQTAGRIWETLLGLQNSVRMCFYYATLQNITIIMLYYWIFFSQSSTEEEDNLIYRYAKKLYKNNFKNIFLKHRVKIYTSSTAINITKKLWENISTISSQDIENYLKSQFSSILGCLVLYNSKILLKAILS